MKKNKKERKIASILPSFILWHHRSVESVVELGKVWLSGSEQKVVIIYLAIKKKWEHPVTTQTFQLLEIGPIGSMHLMLKNDLCYMFLGNEKENKVTTQAV